MSQKLEPLPYSTLRGLNDLIHKIRDAGEGKAPEAIDVALALRCVHSILCDLMLRYAIHEGRLHEVRAHVEAKRHG
jgi:hypothetical protein